MVWLHGSRPCGLDCMVLHACLELLFDYAVLVCYVAGLIGTCGDVALEGSKTAALLLVVCILGAVVGLVRW